MAEALVIEDNKKMKILEEAKRGKKKCALIGAVVVLAIAMSVCFRNGHNHKSCHCSQDSQIYTGIVEDCCCDYETIDCINGEVLHPLLQELVRTPFFRYFKEMNFPNLLRRRYSMVFCRMIQNVKRESLRVQLITH